MANAQVTPQSDAQTPRAPDRFDRIRFREFDPPTVFGSGHLLDYLEARRAIYLPAYRWVLEHRLSELVARLRELGQEKMVVLLDYETNVDVNDPRKPLSHAGLVAAWAEGRWSEMTGG